MDSGAAGSKGDLAMHRNHHWLSCLMLAVFLPFASACAANEPAEPPAEHAHGEPHGHAPSALALDAAGERWATDAPLREGMLRIRAAVAATLASHGDRHLDPAVGVQLAEAVDAAVVYLFANCRLPPQADANLHLLLARIMDAAAALRSDAQAEAGLVRLLEALEAYPHYFDHPGWDALVTDDHS
jgi:hypothetical protein